MGKRVILKGMKRFAPAKVNLSLLVSDVRPDGYHDLDSVVTLLSLGDWITLEQAPEMALTITSETVDLSALPADIERNLAVRAVRLLERRVGKSLPTRIAIEKQIPLGGGLGGGSSNAATVLMGVNDLWGLGLATDDLCALGAELGSDVPLFILNQTVRMRGRGERVDALNLAGAPSLTLVLVNDGTHCSTPAVYQALDRLRAETRREMTQRATQETALTQGEAALGAGLEGELTGSSEGLPQPKTDITECDANNYLTKGDVFCDTLGLSLRQGEAKAVANLVQNDLEKPCFSLFPNVGETAQKLLNAGCKRTLLCGSGATICGIVENPEEGERVLQHPALANCWRATVQTLPDGVMAAHGPLTPIVMVRIHVGQPVCPCV